MSKSNFHDLKKTASRQIDSHRLVVEVQTGRGVLPLEKVRIIVCELTDRGKGRAGN
jgi:hypothetical protein